MDGPILRSKPEGGAASVVLAVHNQKPSHHSPTKIYHAPNQSDLAMTSFTVVMTEKQGRTELYRKRAGPYLTYQNAKWKLFLRKEVRVPLSCVYIWSEIEVLAKPVHHFKETFWFGDQS